MSDIKIYQSISKTNESFQVDKFCIPYYYEPGIGTEYDLFKEISTQTTNEPWGLISSKFHIKSHINIEEFSSFAKNEIENGVDCVFINPMIINESLFHNVWEQGIVVGHQGIDKIKHHLDKISATQPNELMNYNIFAFCNYFIGNNVFWNKYFTYVDKVLENLEHEFINQSEVGKIYNSSANYHKNLGMTLKPFVVERLFSSFLLHSSSQNLTIKTIKTTEKHFHNKCGVNYGSLLYKLSELKLQKTSTIDNLKIWNDIRIKIISNKAIFFGLLHLDDPDTTLMEISNTINII